MKRWIVGTLVSFSAVGAAAQGGGRTLQFSLNREGPPAVQYTIAVGENGTGVYVGHAVTGPVEVVAAPGDGKALRVTPAVIKKLFAAVPMVEGGRCETHLKSIAKTGVKTLRYAGPGTPGQCVYNYSDDDRVNDATSTFEAIAQTMEYGDRLASKLRFDRLGLDTELDGLQGAVTDGRALEVGNIAPVLHTISQDERVMDRVRRKAERLLQSAGPTQSAAGADSSDR